MSQVALQYRGTVESARGLALELVQTLAGEVPDRYGIARGVYWALGQAALTDIKRDFIRKARGHTGEDGRKWPALSREYLAYGRRFGKTEQAKLKKAAGLGKRHSFAPGGNKGLLTKEQLAQWRYLFATKYARLALSMNDGEAKARAAQYAWAVMKRRGAKTKLEVFGNRTVEILRDTSILLNSISPGELTPAGYEKPTEPGGDQQIFDLFAGGVIVGTNVPYAATHNFGDPNRGIPERRFIPDPVPDAWLERWGEIVGQAFLAAAQLAYGAQSKA